MPTMEVTAKNFDDVVKNGIVLLDFWAAWCGPCRAFAPIFEAASDRHPDVVFGKIDTEAEQELAGAFRVQSIPTLMVFRDGVLLMAQPGMVPAQALDEVVEKAKALDMDDVRRQIEEHRKASAAQEGDAEA